MKRDLPALSALPARPRATFEPPSAALARWNPSIRAAADGDEAASISVLDVIGEDYWSGDGVTAKRIAGALRAIGGADVVVNINSPGGDMFEGLAIYNLLREYEGRVTVNVLGLAASAASIIAMAGDEIRIGRAAFLMIHNCWIAAVGNKEDLREAADYMEPFDAAMADVYCARTGLDAKEVASLMEAETWIGGSRAVEQGFADALLPSDAVKEGGTNARASALRAVDVSLAKSGMPRSERRRLLAEIRGTPSAASHSTPSAAESPEVVQAAAALLSAVARHSSVAKQL